MRLIALEILLPQYYENAVVVATLETYTFLFCSQVLYFRQHVFIKHRQTNPFFSKISAI